MKNLKTYEEINETKTPLAPKDFEQSYHYSNEKEAKDDLKSMGYSFKGYVSAGEGFEHIWIEQWEGKGEEGKEPIARLVWLGNITLKNKPLTILEGANVTIIQWGHAKYKDSKEMKFT